MPDIKRISWEAYYKHVKNIAEQINKTYDFFYGIPRGGLVPAVLLSHIMSVPVLTHLDFNEMDKHSILIVDDIVDSGKTIKKFKKIFDTAALFCKITINDKPTYFSEYVDDNTWIMFPYEINTSDAVSKVNLHD